MNRKVGKSFSGGEFNKLRWCVFTLSIL